MRTAATLTLIDNGTLYTPQPAGRCSLLLAGGSVLAVGRIDRAALDATGLPCEVIDAEGCLVVPGFIDPHEHLIGAGGEHGFASRMPEVSLEQIISAGITTVVGCLGTDTTTRHLTSLLAKARQLEEQGISAFMYTGGFPVPPPTITGSVTDDLVLIDKVIGLGEIAISDTRSVEPSRQELARYISEVLIGGMVGGKAGVTHFHLGPGKARLALLRDLLDAHEIAPEVLYPTHITRSRELLDEAIALSHRGCYVDMDTVEDGVENWVYDYRERGGRMDRLTLSSDAQTPGGSPKKLYATVVACVQGRGMDLAEVLPCVTTNTASVLQLRAKGRLEPGSDGDVAVLHEGTLDVVHLFARGRHLVKDGHPVAPPDGQQ